MLCKIKETMKEWLIENERLYWYIIIGLAVFAFGFITMLGMAKLEKANAATTTDGVFYYDLKTEVAAQFSGGDISQFTEIIETYPYMAVAKHKSTKNMFYFFSDVPFEGRSNYAGSYLHYKAKIDVMYDQSVNLGLNGVYFWSVYKKSDGSYVTDDNNAVVNNSNIQYIGSNCEFTVASGYTGTELLALPQKNLQHPNGPLKKYSSDAPYVTFDYLSVENHLNKGTIVSVKDAESLYSEYFVPSQWNMFYKLKNISDLDISYKLNLKFEVEIPTFDYVRGLYDDFGYDFTSNRTILRRNTELIEYWNKDDDADSRTFIIDYSVDVNPSVYNIVNYSFSFMEWEYLLRACSSAFNTELDGYSASERAVLLSFMHVRKITTEVITTRSNSVIYGGYTTNRFERGIYDSCVDVYTQVDKNSVTSDSLDDMISDDLSAAEKEYQKELEERINALENQLGSMTNTNNAFGNLEGSDIWTGFVSLSDGLSSLAPAIKSLSLLTGAVFAFIPIQVTGIMSFTLLAICIIAIIKAIRG